MRDDCLARSGVPERPPEHEARMQAGDPILSARRIARDLYGVAVEAADPALATARALDGLPPASGRTLLVAVGKAAVAMAEAALERLADSAVTALVVTNSENARPLPGASVIAAGHPVPDANGAKAAAAVEALLVTATAQDRVLALISGGGSALLPAPVAGITLEDKAAVNRLLLASGFGITEMNAVRQHLSRLKGGGFLRAAAPAPVTALILSDVIGDDLRVIASGLTTAPIAARADVVALLRARGIWDRLPPAVAAHLQTADAALPPPPAARNILIGSNRTSLDAMRAASPVADTRIVSDHLTGDVADACTDIVAAAKGWDGRHPACLIFGGETTVILRGTGLGGRNQELALRVALAGLPGNWVFLSGGTDGRDGPTDAAGGLVDPGSIVRMRAAGADPQELLADNDSHAALAASGDLLRVGATGTNVADVQVLVLMPG
jgi:glycerate 2-kinase